MKTKSRIEYAYYPSAMSPELCDQIIEICDSLSQAPGMATLENGGSHVDKKQRHDLIAWIPNEPKYKWLYLEIFEIFKQLNQRHWQTKIYSVDNIQYSKYGPDCHFDWHQDWVDPEQNKLAGQRKVSLTIQLSDSNSYVGGYFEIAQNQNQNAKKPENYDFRELDINDPQKKLGEAVRPKGTIIAFPAKFWHRVTPIHSGVRRSLVSWGLGP